VVVAAGSPEDALVDFYAYAESGNFDAAAAMWTRSMRERYPPAEYIDRRFSRTTDIVINALGPADYDGSGERARVPVDLTERLADGTARRFRGAWDVIATDSGWKLAQPYF
jgi:hypothetical protein